MATENPEAPTVEPVPLKLKRRRRATTSPKAKARYWTKETRPRSPGRPKGAITSPYATVTGLMNRVWQDPLFQNNFLWRFQNGQVTPSEIQLAAYYVEGRPGYKVTIQTAEDPQDEKDRERIRRMDPKKIAEENDLIRKLADLRAMRALPQAIVLSSETTEAEVVPERIEVNGQPLSAVVDTSPEPPPA
jgi:hypothetical protein